MYRKIKLKLKSVAGNKTGFTLIEVIVTMVILGILITGSVMSLMAWQRHSIYKKNNEYAQTLFLAAQSALASMEAGGGLDSLEQYVKGSSDNEYCGKAENYSPSRSLYYMDIHMNEEDAHLQSNPLYQLLKNYVYDEQIFNAAIRLEFDPEDGSVYAVSYSERVKCFDYSDSDGSDGKSMGITKDVRENDGRRQKQLMGYYDTDLAKYVSKSYYKPTFRDVELINEETLRLHMVLSAKYRPYLSRYSYTLNIYDDTDKKRISFTIDGEQLMGTDIDGGKSTHSAEVLITRYNDSGKAKTDTDKSPIEVRVNTKGEIDIILDGADLNSAAVLNEAIIADATDTDILDPLKYQKTTSIVRLMKGSLGSELYGISSDTTYIYVDAVASYENFSGKRSYSQKEHPFFGNGEKKRSSKNGTTYSAELLNGRHLFNIRFLEAWNSNQKDSEQVNISYIQKKDIHWSGEKGIAAAYSLYDTSAENSALLSPEELYQGHHSSDGIPTNKDSAPFPAIPYLGANSSYNADGGLLKKDYSIHMLTLYEENASSLDMEQDNPETVISLYALGLFRVNEGRIQNLQVYDSRVDGRNYVGTICGWNKGILKDISVSADKNSNSDIDSGKRNYVHGDNFVGGICGSDMLPLIEDAETVPASTLTENYENLVNESDIAGFSYVGGIIGASCLKQENAATPLSIINCKNKGKIEVSSTANTKDICENLGGITGYLCDGNIENCNSTLGTVDFMDFTVSDDFFSTEDLLGNYMGGIAGRCTSNARITNCSSDGGVLKGRNYIGGIVGLWDSEPPLEGNGKSNTTAIIGYNYVGGIAGANTSVDKDGLPLLESESTPVISNWSNKGIIATANSYGGGITGYNTGTLTDCTSTMDTYSVKGEDILSKIKVWKTSDPLGYVGGLVGYNNGTVISTSRHDVVTIVSGGNYTGGLIGYNDAEATVSLDTYVLKGGYIDGEAFTGGLIGCNTSSHIFKTEENSLENYVLQSNPNSVSGSSFVGGCIGGNLVSSENDLYLQCSTANQFGTVTAESSSGPLRTGGCVGGFIGYNYIFPADESTDTISSYIKTLAEEVNIASHNYQNHPGDPNNPPPKKDDESKPVEGPSVSEVLIKNLLNEKADSPLGKTLHIINISNGCNTMDTICGGIMVGGIVGHNDKASSLEIKNVTSQSRIVSMHYIASTIDHTCLKKENDSYRLANITYEHGSINPFKSDGEIVNYSYTGGIIGLVTSGVTIDSCANMGLISVAEETTYKGSVAEVNEGIIKNCNVQSLGDTSSIYLGGITGCNKTQGRIYNCSLTDTITGKAVIGGIAAENYGIITSSELSNQEDPNKTIQNGRINVNTICAGGIAGFNAGTISQIRLNTSIDGTASYVGGITGINYGSLTDFEIAGNSQFVNGSAYVGGCAGYMRNITENKLIIGGTSEVPLNIASTVTASGLTINSETLGNAGGVIGYIDGDNITVQFCKVSGQVSALSGNAGGITSSNTSGELISCTVNGNVRAANGMCGGIAAINQAGAKIIGCGIANVSDISVQGSTYTGGIAAKNAGSITSCFVATEEGTLTLNNSAASSGNSAIGGIVGINEQTGVIGNDSETESNACWVGHHPNSSTKTSFPGIDTDGYSVQITSGYSGSRLGGVAGVNLGSIYGGQDKKGNIKYIYSHIYVNDNDNITGWLGGVTGINSGTIKNVYCASHINGKNGSEGGFGGIAGENRAIITNCDFSGMVSAKGSVADIVSVGGIAGKNTSDGEITKCTIANSNDTTITTKNTEKNTCSYIGGIAGRNDGKISEIFCNTSMPDNNNSKDTGYTIHTVNISASMANIGGMVGYQTASGSLNNCINNGNWSVEANAYYSDTAIGGMIGYSASDKDMSYLTNYAAVSRTGNNSNSAGGIAGRLESMNSSTKKVSYCNNYGNISDSARVGGIIGQWKYKGGEIEYCTNHGNIVQNNVEGVGAGGIIGVLYQINAGETLRINECINHGIINGGKNCAGILGDSRVSSGKSTIQFIQCVNTGNIGINNGAGIFANNEINATCELTGCRNYGYGSADGNNFSGIFGQKTSGTVTMKNCFGIAEVEPRLTSADLKPQSQHNFYFAESNEEDSSDITEAVFMNPLIGNYTGKIAAENSLSKAFDFNNNTRLVANNNPDSDKDKRLYISIDLTDYLGRPVALPAEFMQITWFADNTDKTIREHYFKLYVKYENEDEFTCLNPTNEYKYSVNNESFWVGYGYKNNEPPMSLPAENNKMVQINFSESPDWRKEKITSVKLEYYSNSISPKYCSIWDIYIDGVSEELRPSLDTTAPLYIKKQDNEFRADILEKIRTPYIPKLTSNPCSWNSTSIELYNSIDAQLKAGASQNKKLSKPQNVNLSQSESNYTLSWDPVNGATQYKVNIYLYDSADSTNPVENMGLEMLLPFVSSTDIPLDSVWSGKFMRASVTALNILSTEEENYDSNAAISNCMEVRESLPTPNAHLEKHYDKDGAYYTINVDNIEDYKGYVCSFIAYKNNDKLFNPISIENLDSKTGEGITKLRNIPESDDNVSLQFQALSDTGLYLNSPKIAVQTALPNDATLKGNAIASITMKTEGVPNFTGSSPESLGFISKLNTGKQSAYYCKSELLIFDAEVGMDVAVSSTETFISTYSGNVTATLGNISPKMAASLLEQENPKITARTYLWATQGHSVYFGKKRPINGDTPLKAEEVVEKYPDLFIPAADSDSNTSEPTKYHVKDGYTVERISVDNDNQDPVYNIYYSTFLAEKAVYPKQVQSVTAELKNNRVAVPIFNNDYVLEGENFIFSWTIANESAAPDGYNVKITGITPDNRRVELLTTKGQPEKEIKLPRENWNYKEVEVAVTSLGTINKNNIVSKFFNYSSKVYRTYLPLPQITMPRVKLHDNNQDELLYDISWNAITEDYPRKDLAEYQVYALVPLTDTDGNKLDPETLKLAYGPEVHAYPDAEDTSLQTGWKILLGTKTKDAPPEEEDSYRENVLENCSLEALQGCRVRFFVNAIAVSHEDSDDEEILYTDSSDGVMSNEMLIPKRLVLPDDLLFNLTYGDNKTDEVRTEEEFLNLIMNCAVTSKNAQGDGAYKFEAGIYPEKQDELTIVEQTDGGSFKVTEDACENGSIKIPPLVPEDKILVTTPSGSLQNTVLTLKADDLSGWSQDLAGKYLIIRCRIADNSNISSLWSEYQVYRLPSSELAVPSLSEKTVDFTKGEYEGTQYQLSWSSVAHASGYRIVLENLSKKQTTLVIDFSEDGTPELHVNGQKISSAKDDNSYTYTISDFSYSAEWPWESGSSQKMESVLTINSKVQLDGTFTYDLVLKLPDINDLETDQNKIYQYLYTSAVQVTALAAPDTAYHDSYHKLWLRIADKNDSKNRKTAILDWNGTEEINQTIQSQDGLADYIRYETEATLPEIITSGANKSASVSQNSIPKHNQVSGNSVSNNSVPDDSEKPDSETETESDSETGSEIESESESESNSSTDSAEKPSENVESESALPESTIADETKSTADNVKTPPTESSLAKESTLAVQEKHE